MNKLILCVLLLLYGNLEGYKYKLAISAVTKNENAYIVEWIDYHIKVGVDHFYLYDNNDDNSLKVLLKSYIKKGIVDLKNWPNRWPEKNFITGCQTYAYRHALERAKGKAEWLAIMDSDEYIVPMQGKSIVDILRKSYANSSVIYINWLMFGTNHVTLQPGDSMLKQLIRCSANSNDYNKFGKTICRPEYVKKVVNVHEVRSDFPYYDGSGNLRFRGAIASNLLRLNHYMLRDENFLNNVKIPRYAQMWGLTKQEAEYVLRSVNDSFMVEEDSRMLQLLLP